jgi:hypothetical protein
MLILLIISVIAGFIVLCVTGIEFLGIAVGIILFVCGLPGALLVSFVYGVAAYTQDRADYRETMSGIATAELADEHEYAEDARTDRLVESVGKNRSGNTYNDNRQVHLHGVQP